MTLKDTAERKARSPYQRYKKTPYRYSPALVAWREAIKANKPAQAAIHDQEWRRANRAQIARETASDDIAA